MGKKSKAPPPPDPTQVAQQQTQLNQQNAGFNQAVNRGNTTTPLGSQTFDYRGTDPRTGAPIYDENVSLSPEQQQLYQQQVGQSLAVGDTAGRLLPGVESAYGQPIDTSGLPQVYGANDTLGARKEAQDAIYGQYASYLDPQYAERDRQLNTTLANKGVVEGSEAYNNAQSQQGRERAFDYGRAREAAVVGGGAEQSRLYNMSQDAHTRGLAEMLQLRDRPFEEFSAVSGMRDPAQLPQFSSAPDVQAGAVDVTNPIYQSYQGGVNIANANQAAKNSLVGSAAKIGGTALLVF